TEGRIASSLAMGSVLMARMNILSYRILLFERHDHGYIAPEHYPREALVCLSSHDLPTFRGLE
uniref:4-alpha-glucanotransferase n=1 Tax=Klebsiella aerogenes TaxID=548 RepID=UPI001952CE99